MALSTLAGRHHDLMHFARRRALLAPPLGFMRLPLDDAPSEIASSLDT
jgi:hypothetical protein